MSAQHRVSPLWLKRLGSRFRQARRARGLTQADVASPNLTKSFISLLESARTYPSVETLVALVRRLETSLALLVLDADQLPRETALSLLALARSRTPTPPASVDRLLLAAEALIRDAHDLHADLLLARGDIALTRGQVKQAKRRFEEALAYAKRRRLRTYQPCALTRLAELAARRKNLATAREQLEEALTQFRSTRTLRSVDGCAALILYGRVLSQQGELGRALRVLEEVAEVAERYDLPAMLGRIYKGIGLVHAASGRPEQAAEARRRAKDAVAKAGKREDLAEALH